MSHTDHAQAEGGAAVALRSRHWQFRGNDNRISQVISSLWVELCIRLRSRWVNRARLS